LEIDWAAHALTSGATGGSKRAVRTLPSSASSRCSSVLTTTVTLSARGRSAMHVRTVFVIVAVGLRSVGSGGFVPTPGARRGSGRPSADDEAPRRDALDSGFGSESLGIGRPVEA